MRRILILIVIGFLAAYAWYRYDHRGQRVPESFTLADEPRLDISQVQVLAALDAEYTRLVNAVVPSVVSITSSRTVLQPAPLTVEDLLMGRQRAQRAKSTSLGSGVIVSKEGHILTNHHVIGGMTEIRVQLPDGRNIAARLIGSDPASDIAVLRIDEGGITPLPLGDSDALQVGQQVFAIGNPFGLEESVSRGIVSAKGRRTRTDSGVEFIQHDAAVNTGNSGGPLLNIRGEIVGINSQIITGTGGFQGISLAIPSNTARRIMESILQRGRVVRGWLGVGLQAISPQLAAHFGLPDTKGALVTEVMPGSPAERAGLRPGDTIRRFNGRVVEDVAMFRSLIAATEIGSRVPAEVLREGRISEIELQVVEVPQQFLQQKR